MRRTEIVLLPGMDGTGSLFDSLVRLISSTFDVRIVSYPPSEPLTYAQLLERVSHELDVDRPVMLVAESFSGPLAVRYAAAHPEHVRAVVLCASFVRNPLPICPRWIMRPGLFRLPFRHLAIRSLLLNGHGSPALTAAVVRAVQQVAPGVLAGRLRDIAKVDCTPALLCCSAPMLYLRAQHDRLVRRASLQAILDARPDVLVREIAGPHMLLQAAPEAAWREIARFLSECRVV